MLKTANKFPWMRGEMVDEGIRMTLYQSCELLGRRSLHLTFLDRTDKN